MILRWSTLAALLFAVSFQGYSAVAAFTAFSGVNNTPFSLAMRIGIVAISLAIMAKIRMPDTSTLAGKVFLAALFFWIVYFCRLAQLTVMDPAGLVKGLTHYWIWAVGSCFIPMMAIASLPASRRPSVDQLFNLTLAIVFIATVLIAINIVMFGSSVVLHHGRLQLEALNPISLGHSGAIMALLSLHYVIIKRSGTLSLKRLVFGIFGIMVGTSFALASGARGAIVALIAAVLFQVMATRSCKQWILLIAVAIVCVVLLPIIIDALASNGVSVTARITNGLNNVDSAISWRQVAYAAALNVFLEYPILGLSVVDPVFNTYPHNIVLEALMSTGLIGGIPLIFAIVGSVMLAWRRLRARDGGEWLSLLYVEALTGAMFSGAIYSVGAFWISLAALIAFPALKHQSE